MRWAHSARLARIRLSNEARADFSSSNPLDTKRSVSATATSHCPTSAISRAASRLKYASSMGVPLASSVAPDRMALSSPASCSKHTSPSRANAFNRSGPSLRKRFTRVQSPIRCPSSIEKVSALSATSQSRSLNRSATRERASATLSAFHVSSVSSPALTRPWASRRPPSSVSPG